MLIHEHVYDFFVDILKFEYYFYKKFYLTSIIVQLIILKMDSIALVTIIYQNSYIIFMNENKNGDITYESFWDMISMFKGINLKQTIFSDQQEKILTSVQFLSLPLYLIKMLIIYKVIILYQRKISFPFGFFYLRLTFQSC